jgi:hypothetical protein
MTDKERATKEIFDSLLRIFFAAMAGIILGATTSAGYGWALFFALLTVAP